MQIQVGHSPDADDAFMFYALTHGKIDTEELEFKHILKDIETLNRWALQRKLEVTAISVHAYAHVCGDYAMLSHGASIGENYGPLVVARKEITVGDLKNARIAIPGEMTTAFLALSLCLGKFSYQVIPFDRIFDAVRSETVDAGLIIHEGQLTYPSEGFRKILDLGSWWYEKTSLPLPLGVNAIRKNLGKDLCSRISRYLHQSIDYALEHREEALAYAMNYARNTEKSMTDQFVGMYVNEFTRNLGVRGTHAVLRLLKEGSEAGIIPRIDVEIIP